MPYPPLRRTTTDLPIEASLSTISDAIRAGSLVLVAEPGAGKSSIVPILAADAVEEAGSIVVLEPRRLAARATAQRLSQLLVDCAGVGDLVGLTIRGERRHSARTRIEVVTEAVLTNRLQRDPELPGVAGIVFDEFHERSLHGDLGLAMALESRATIRPDLALLVMSATLDANPVAALLGDEDRPATVIDVPGRTFPVDTLHLHRPESRGFAAAVATATQQALGDVTGDVLVFVPGRREIDAVIGELERRTSNITVVGLHGGSNSTAQRAALSHGESRRIIVATAVAETSVTIPGIEAVVDGGLLRRAVFDPVTGLGRLETVHATRFAADQRRGRAGRLGPGRCYRLWSIDDHRHLDDAVPPEITDGDPLPVTFELARWGDPLGADLPLLDHPGPARLVAGQAILRQLGLVDESGSLTPAGRTASKLGTHPRIGALVLTAQRLGLLEVGLRAAAVMDDDRFATTSDLGAEVDRRWADLRRPVDRFRRRITGAGPAGGRDEGRSQLQELGPLLAAAWPDRIAMRREKRPGHFLLANGREAQVPANDRLAGAEFLVVAEAGGIARGARIRRAVELDRTTVLESVPDAVAWHEHVEWDDRSDSIRSERQQRIGSIILHRQPLASPGAEAIADALTVGLRRRGLELLTWSDESRSIRQRLAWLHEADPQTWPAMDDGSLLVRRDEWLDLSRCRTPADLRRLRVGTSLLALLDWTTRSTFDDLAPITLPLPGGGRSNVDYSSGRPVWSVRIQRLFGLDQHPLIGPKTEPVTIELLSPANRPAQVTTDLPGFWRGSYAGVRTDLRGRYPKHSWPEEPWNAAPSKPTQPRRR